MKSADASGENVATALAALAATQPYAPLLHLPGRPPVTYGELHELIGRVCAQLQGWGIAPGDIVAGCLQSRPQMALACVALPSSSTFAPLSPTLTAQTYASLLARLAPKAVLAPAADDHPLRLAAASLGIASLRVVEDPASALGTLALVPAGSDRVFGGATRASPEYAYVLVTSGTTGRPKLVPIGHRQMLLFAKTMIDWLRFAPSDIGCSLSPFHLAGGLRATLLIPAFGGGSIACLPEGDVDGFFDALDRFGLTYLGAGFAIHRAILRRAVDFREAVARSRLRFLRTTAGRLEPDEIERLESTFDAPVLVGLGSTEAAGIAHDPLPPLRRKRGAVGIPTAGEVAIMDAAGRIRPRGTPGEIVVRSPLVFDGYLDDPELTAASFLDGWFRTGDLGRIDADGYVFLSGRLKEQINRGGEKISPDEIDRVLESLSGVREAATFGIPHPNLGEELVAAVVRESGATMNEADVVDHVSRQIGPLRVPRRIYFLDRLPRTDSGKVRRGDLAQRVGLHAGASTSAFAADARPPSSPLEGALAGLWAATLRKEVVRRDDDFFVLGGDSLIGAQLLREVKTLFGTELPLHALFGGAATVAGMASAIERQRIRDAQVRAGAIAVAVAEPASRRPIRGRR